MWQSQEVVRLLSAAHPGLTFEIRTELSGGDVVLDRSLASLATESPGVFTKELEVRAGGLWVCQVVVCQGCGGRWRRRQGGWCTWCKCAGAGGGVDCRSAGEPSSYATLRIAPPPP